MRALVPLCLAALAFSLAPAAAQTAADLAGNWGVASYWAEKDAARAKQAAAAACSQPFPIRTAPSGKLLLTGADDPAPKETALAAEGAALRLSNGDPRSEREITGYDGRSFTLRWLNPGVATRYGVNVYVRCGSPRARTG